MGGRSLDAPPRGTPRREGLTTRGTVPTAFLQSSQHQLRQSREVETQVIVVYRVVDSAAWPVGALRALGQILVAALRVFRVAPGLSPQCTHRSRLVPPSQGTMTSHRAPTWLVAKYHGQWRAVARELSPTNNPNQELHVDYQSSDRAVLVAPSTSVATLGCHRKRVSTTWATMRYISSTAQMT